MRRRTLVLAMVLVAAAGGLAACGGDGDDQPPTRGAGAAAGRSEAPLVSTEWFVDQEASGLAAVPSAVAHAQFSNDGRLTGNDGCNQYSTTYRVVGSRLRVTSPIAGTLIACPDPVMRVAQDYLARLERARSFTITGRVLTVRTRGGDPLVFDALDPETAVAGPWEVVSYFRPGAVVSPVPGSTLTATFADGQISGDSGCNTFSGPYEVDDTRITIGPLASTLRACADPAVDQQSTQYLAALELARTFSVAGGNLTLLRDDGGIAVTFTRA